MINAAQVILNKKKSSSAEQIKCGYQSKGIQQEHQRNCSVPDHCNTRLIVSAQYAFPLTPSACSLSSCDPDIPESRLAFQADVSVGVHPTSALVDRTNLHQTSYINSVELTPIDEDPCVPVRSVFS
jgi:hypothetical protein